MRFIHSDIEKDNLSKLRELIKHNKKHIVVVYVQRIFGNIPDKKLKNRLIEDKWEKNKINIYEETFIELNPIKEKEIKSIRNLTRDLITPFIYAGFHKLKGILITPLSQYLLWYTNI